MTEPIQPRTYRTPSGRVLTDADIQRMSEEVATADLDLTEAKVRYRPEPSRPARNAAARSPREP